jgi:hypothetical protein
MLRLLGTANLGTRVLSALAAAETGLTALASVNLDFAQARAIADDAYSG